MAKSNIYIFTYNNYFNRIVKKENSLADYGTPEHTLLDTNFDYADGVSTQHVFNYNGDGDYLIVTDSENNIKHRWFIIENKKTRGGQYIFKLRRDLIVDYYDLVVNSPLIVNRAIINNVDNPLLLNSEGFNFNQIKTGEYKLTEARNNEAYFYALYFAKDAVAAGVESTESFPTISGSINLNDQLPYDIAVQVPIAQSIYKAQTYKNITNYGLNINMMYDYDSRYNDRNKGALTILNSSNVAHTVYPQYVSGSTGDYLQINTDMPDVATAMNAAFTGTFNDFKAALELETGDIPNPISDANLAKLNEASNGNFTIKDSDNKFWKVNVTVTPEIVGANSNGGAVWSWANGVINTTDLTVQRNNSKSTNYAYMKTTVRVTLQDITPQNNQLNYNINFSNFYNTNAPYNIVLIPANDQDMIVEVKDRPEPGQYQSRAIKSKQSYNNKILNKIMLAAGKWLLDVQIIPYFPQQDLLVGLVQTHNKLYINYDYYGSGYSGISVPHFYESHVLDLIQTYNDTGWWAYYVENPSFEFNITNGTGAYAPINIKVNDSSNPTAMDYKLENECTLYRITSPNYNGSFEFNLAKNQGLESINVDVTLRPYNPYIHINPKFSYLYGEDYNDCRGLICQGDFSMPIITDQFKNYEIENKNYQQMFIRQIDHLEFKQGQERTQAAWGILGGTMAGVAGGALAGGRLGSAAAGAAVGGGLSLAGGLLDYSLMEERQREDKDYMIDNYRYQLGNIKALPTTTNKITPLTNNNKIFPVLEKYTCSETEKELLRSYLNFRSMTVEKIGYISEYKQSERSFISGTLLRLEGSGLANNELFELYDELKKGVYI